MAKIITDTFIIRLSKLIKDNTKDENDLLTGDQYESLRESIPELVESIVSDESIIVEVVSE